MGFAAAIAVPAPAFATALSEIPAPAAVPPLTPAQPIGFAPDPIFDVIKRHTRAMKAYAKAHRRYLEHADDEQPPRRDFVVVGEQPERELVELVVLCRDQWEFHDRYELTGKMIPLVARSKSDIERHAPADLDEIERARWIRRKYRELLRATRADEAARDGTPRSQAWEAWNESGKIIERLTKELTETTPATLTGAIAVMAYWAKVMTIDTEPYALDAISTKDFLRKLSKRAGTMIAEV
jgi:hypothetical protein